MLPIGDPLQTERHILIKLTESKYKERILKNQQEKSKKQHPRENPYN